MSSISAATKISSDKLRAGGGFPNDEFFDETGACELGGLCNTAAGRGVEAFPTGGGADVAAGLGRFLAEEKVGEGARRKDALDVGGATRCSA